MLDVNLVKLLALLCDMVTNQQLHFIALMIY